MRALAYVVYVHRAASVTYSDIWGQTRLITYVESDPIYRVQAFLECRCNLFMSNIIVRLISTSAPPRRKFMLVGLFLRHYKVYKNINFVPISTGAGLCAFLGANGIGKSSILDALDKFFNGGDWSINAQAKSEGGVYGEDKLPYIVPVFALPKAEITGAVSETASILSEYLWQTTLRTTEVLSTFYNLREQLLSGGMSPETHFLLAIGRQLNRSTAYLGSYHTDGELWKALNAAGKGQTHLDELLAKVTARFSYFYIPVEVDPSVFSKLESTHVQKLMDEDIREKIQKAIGSSTVGSINTSLQEFVSEINDSLKHYKYRGTHKDKLTMNDLVEKVFDAYFSIKVLHRASGSSTIPIRDMSAGEKRRSLIDLAYSLLARSAARAHRVILAIDEPDASLHTSACHDHFSRLAEIPSLTDPSSQVLITTHWYGFLPVVQDGIAHSITEGKERVEFFSFDLYNFREQIKHAVKSSHGELPRDIELKSYNDMLQSIVSSTVRTPPYNWILCEGLSDKIYLDFYLQDLIESQNLRIVPLGGFKEVRRAFTYLKAPLDDPEYKITGKVLCLVDTDAKLEKVDSKPESKAIDFQRIIYDESLGDVTLVKIDDQLVAPATEIEHALEASRFLETVASLPDDDESLLLKEIVQAATPVETALTSYGYLNLTPSANRAMMSRYFDVGDNKVLFARTYVGDWTPSESPPAWIEKVRAYFMPPIKKIKKVQK